MRIITCNIRTGAAWDKQNSWPLRRELCFEVIRSRTPDIICCQEAREDQAADMREQFREFDTYGMPDEPTGPHPMNLLLFRRDRFRLVGTSAFWLSETPHVPGSSSWNSACVRLLVWARLVEDGTGADFVVATTHLDHMSQAAREGGARKINEWAAAFPAHYPLILTGDLNSGPTNPVIALLKDAGWRDSWEEANGAEEPGYTCHGFRGLDPANDTEPWAQRIDWILLRGGARAQACEIVRDGRDGRYPATTSSSPPRWNCPPARPPATPIDGRGPAGRTR